MAEIVSVVASGAGVASLGIQLLQAVYGLKDFCSSIKDAPIEVTGMVDELLILTSILKQIFDRNPTAALRPTPEPMWDACHDYCVSAVDILTGVATELEASLKKHKFVGKLKVALSQQKINIHRERLERAKSMLLLAQQVSLFTFIQFQNTSLLTNIETMHDLLITSSTLQGQTRNMIDEDAVQESDFDRIDTSYVARSRHQRKTFRIGTKWTYRVSPWWLNRAFEIQRHHSWTGWSFSFRCYKILPLSSLLSVGRSSVMEVIQLFKGKQLFLWDQDLHGRTLLHTAALAQNIELCRFLIQQGLIVNSESSSYYQTPFDMFWGNNYHDSNRNSLDGHPDLIEMTRLLAIENGADEVLHPHHVDPYKKFSGHSMSSIDYCMRHLTMTIDSDKSMQYRVTSALLSKEFDARFFWIRLGTRSIPQLRLGEILIKHCDLCWMLFARIAGHFGYVYSITKNRAAISEKMAGWQEIVQSLDLFVPISITPTAKRWIGSIGSPLSSLLNSILFDERALPGPNYNPQDLTRALHAWVQWLSDIGFDIVKYGKLEIQCIKLRPEPFTEDWPLVSRYGYRVIGLGIAPIVSDWKIWLNNPLEETVHDFWFLVDNPEYFLPGAWQLSPAGESYGWYSLIRWKLYLSSRRRCRRLLRYMKLRQDTACRFCWIEIFAFLYEGTICLNSFDPRCRNTNCDFHCGWDLSDTKFSSLCQNHTDNGADLEGYKSYKTRVALYFILGHGDQRLAGWRKTPVEVLTCLDLPCSLLQ